MSVPVIAIDGPSGSGKGTIAKKVAEHLSFRYLDSGALYRLAALLVMKKRIFLEDNDSILQALNVARFSFDDSDNASPSQDKNKKIAVRTYGFSLNGEDVTEEIRGEACSQIASVLAQRAEIRAFFLDFQRGYRTAPGLVAEGRDMGTVIFPDADIKIYLHAEDSKRAERRLLQLQQLGKSDDTLESVLVDMERRDEQDAKREHAPLTQTQESILLDNTDLSAEETFAQVLHLIHTHSNIAT